MPEKYLKQPQKSPSNQQFYPCQSEISLLNSTVVGKSNIGQHINCPRQASYSTKVHYAQLRACYGCKIYNCARQRFTN